MLLGTKRRMFGVVSSKINNSLLIMIQIILEILQLKRPRSSNSTLRNGARVMNTSKVGEIPCKSNTYLTERVEVEQSIL